MADDKTLEALTAAIESEESAAPRMSTPWRRAFVLVPYALVALAVLTVIRGARPDAEILGRWMLFGLSAVQLAASYALFRFVLHEAIPGRATRPWTWVGVASGVVVLQLGVSEWTQHRSPFPMDPERAFGIGSTCLGLMTLVGVPMLAIGMVLASRGLPLRPRLTGLATGLVGGLLAEAIYRTHCPYTHLTHMLVWHAGAVAFLALVGFFAGAAWEAQRVERWRERRAR